MPVDSGTQPPWESPILAPMSQDESALRALARARDGVVAWHEARAAGFTPRSIATRVNRGAWSRVGQALVIHDIHQPGDPAEAWLLHLHCGRASVVSGPLAARLQGWAVVGTDHLVINPQPVAPPPGYDVKVLRRADPAARRFDDLPPLAPRRDALADILVSRSTQGARDLLDQALQRRWIATEDLEHVISERSGPGRRGQPRLRELYGRAAGGSRSEAEQRMGLLLTQTPGHWIANCPVLGEQGQILAEIDFADPVLKVAIEVDGRAFHSDRQSFERDRERQNLLVTLGWVVLRFTWERIVNDPEGVIAEVASVCAAATLRIRAQSA